MQHVAGSMKLSYPIKHWFTTLLISPLFLIIYDFVADTKFTFNEASIYFLLLTMGILLSLPSLFIYFFIHQRLINSRLSNIQIRTILLAIAISMVIVTFLLIKGSAMIPMMTSYMLGALTSGWVYPVTDN